MTNFIMQRITLSLKYSIFLLAIFAYVNCNSFIFTSMISCSAAPAGGSVVNAAFTQGGSCPPIVNVAIAAGGFMKFAYT
jgi:hypothetical protein